MFYHILSMAMVRTTNYGHTKAKYLILFNTNSDPKKIFKALFFVEIMVE